MVWLLDGHRLIRPTQPLNIRSRLLHPRRNLMQNAILLLIFVVLIRSRVRVMACSRVRRVNESSVLVLHLVHERKGA